MLIILLIYFFVFVVLWVVVVEVVKCLLKWIWLERLRKFLWDDEEYWKKEGKMVSKDFVFYVK